MTMPKFKPACYWIKDAEQFHVGPKPFALAWKPLHTDDQLTEAYEAGKRDAIPEGWVLVPKEILDRFPEINPSNYDHDDACGLNAWGVELVFAAEPKEEE